MLQSNCVITILHRKSAAHFALVFQVSIIINIYYYYHSATSIYPITSLLTAWCTSVCYKVNIFYTYVSSVN